MQVRGGETGQAEGEATSASSFPLALPGLTSVRFALALGVVLFHYHLASPYRGTDVTGLFERARLGVDAFFILSGFILIHAYDRELIEGRFSYLRFLVARIARIFPLHLAVLAFMGALVAGATVLGADFDRSGYTPSSLLTSSLLVQSWGVAPFPTEWSWNGPSWSLSAEWFAYVTFPGFAVLAHRWRNRPVTLLALAGVLFVVLDAIYRTFFGAILPHAEENLGILRLLPEFLYGVALYRAGQRLRPSPTAALIGAVIAAGLVLSLMHLRSDDRLIVVAFGPLMLALALLSKARVAGWLAARPLTFLGEASFALYLAHMPILLFWKNAVAELTGGSSAYVMSIPELTALFALTLPLACAAHVFLEVPARNLIRSWVDRRPVSSARSIPSVREETP